MASEGTETNYVMCGWERSRTSRATADIVRQIAQAARDLSCEGRFHAVASEEVLSRLSDVLSCPQGGEHFTEEVVDDDRFSLLQKNVWLLRRWPSWGVPDETTVTWTLTEMKYYPAGVMTCRETQTSDRIRTRLEALFPAYPIASGNLLNTFGHSVTSMVFRRYRLPAEERVWLDIAGGFRPKSCVILALVTVVVRNGADDELVRILGRRLVEAPDRSAVMLALTKETTRVACSPGWDDAGYGQFLVDSEVSPQRFAELDKYCGIQAQRQRVADSVCASDDDSAEPSASVSTS